MQSNTENFKFDNISTHRQARFGYGPLLGLLLANFLSNSAVAKFNPLGALKISYEPLPWTTYNKPPSTQDNYNYWQPQAVDPYAPPTASIANATEAQHIHHHHHISSLPNQQQIVSINGGRPPTEIIIDGDYDTGSTDTTDDSVIDESYIESIKTNIETPKLVEEESDVVPVGALPSNQFGEDTRKKRGVSGRYSNNRRNKYNQNRRRSTTTTPDYYEYDSYEDLTTRPKSRAKPKRPIDLYEDSTEEYEYDSYEFTTKPYKKRRRTTTSKPKRNKTKTKNKKKPQKVVADYEDDDDEVIEPVTQVIEIRPRQETTTFETMITDGSTTTDATTTTTTGSSTNNTGYGYGPSNGNENISFTYGPPTGGFQGVYGPPNAAYGPPNSAYGPPLTGNGQYQIPFNNQQGGVNSSPNAFVRQIHDIFEFDNVFH